MKKIYLTYGNEAVPEGFEKMDPESLFKMEKDSVDEIITGDILTRVNCLAGFFVEVKNKLKEGSSVTIYSSYFLSSNTWSHPDCKRGISECSLNFLSDDFEVTYSLGMDIAWETRADEVKQFAIKHYANTVPTIQFKCVKKGSSNGKDKIN